MHASIVLIGSLNVRRKNKAEEILIGRREGERERKKRREERKKQTEIFIYFFSSSTQLIPIYTKSMKRKKT